MVLEKMLERYEAEKAEIESQDIETAVQRRLAEVADKIRAEVVAEKANALNVIGIKISVIYEALEEEQKLVDAQQATETQEAQYEETHDNSY
jgi:hypothetical protein